MARQACRRQGIPVLEPEHLPPGWQLDETRLTLDAGEMGWTGPDLAASLAQEGLQPEMASSRHVVILLTLADESGTGEALVRTLERGLPPSGPGKRPGQRNQAYATPGDAALSPRQAMLASHRLCPLDQARGEISASLVAVDPPGIPLLFPGERVGADCLEELFRARAQGQAVSGLGSGLTVKVVADFGKVG